MLKKFLLLSVVVLEIFFTSCDKEKPNGKWDDIIRLSTKTANFNAGIDSISISTEGTSWWVNDISVNDSTYYGFEDVNPESDSYRIQVCGIIVERRKATTLFIKADANLTGNQRVIGVGLEAGDYFDRVIITQVSN